MSFRSIFCPRALAFVSLVAPAVGCAVTHDAASDESTSEGRTARLGSTPTITFASDWTVRTAGTIAAPGKLEIDYDLARLTTCRGEQGGIPQWGLSASYRVGDGPVKSVDLGGLNTKYLTGIAVATIDLDTVGELQVWFENGNRWGCHAYDSNYGNNYRFTVGLPANAPGWMGNAVFVVSRATCSGGPCDADRHPLTDVFSFDTWARQRAAIKAAYFDVWKSGVTDFDNPDLWRTLDVQVHTRFGDAGSFTNSYVSFDHRVGNDARYVLPLSPLDPFSHVTITTKADCPKVPLKVSADGQYVETELQFWFTVNGVDLRPAAGATYRGKFSDYKGLYAVCL